MIAEYDVCRKLEQSHECAACRNRSMLVTRWNPAAQSHEVYCPSCGERERFVRRQSLTSMWRRDPDSVPVHVANRLSRKYGVDPMTEQALVVASETQMASRIEHARWITNLTHDDRRSLAHLAVQYGLDPLMGELTWYEGRPFISMQGLVRIAHRQPAFEGLEDRPMTSEERAAYGIKAPIGWIAKVYRRGWRVPVVGTGNADPNNPLRNNPVERAQPQWMARSRAIRQALKLAFPHSLPFDQAEDRGLSVDVETGEVLTPPPTADVVETTARVVQDEAPAEPEPAAPSQPARPTPAQAVAARPANGSTQAKAPAGPATEKQLAAIYALGRKGGMDPREVDELSVIRSGKQCADLTAAEASDLITYLNKPPTEKPAPAARPATNGKHKQELLRQYGELFQEAVELGLPNPGTVKDSDSEEAIAAAIQALGAAIEGRRAEIAARDQDEAGMEQLFSQ